MGHLEAISEDMKKANKKNTFIQSNLEKKFQDEQAKNEGKHLLADEKFDKLQDLIDVKDRYGTSVIACIE